MLKSSLTVLVYGLGALYLTGVMKDTAMQFRRTIVRWLLFAEVVLVALMCIWPMDWVFTLFVIMFIVLSTGAFSYLERMERKQYGTSS